MKTHNVLINVYWAIFLLVFLSAASILAQGSALIVRQLAISNQLVVTASCNPAPLALTNKVGGLPVAVPRLPDALRSSYAESATSEYLTEIDSREVIDYYLSELAGQCWTVAYLGSHDATWQRGGETLRLAVADNTLGGRTRLTYNTATSGTVLGVQLAQAIACTDGQMYCPDPTGMGSGYCYTGTTCPSTTTNQPTASSCPTPPTGCTSGFTYDAQGCATSCASTSTYTPPTTNTGCPSGQFWCGTSNSCIANTSTCNYSGSGSTTPAPANCSSSYSQNSTYSCNYSACPSGCTYDGQGCPSGCYTQPTCSGEYQQAGATYPSCDYNKCPTGCNWSNGCPVGCYTGYTGSTGTTCPTGQYWCGSNNSCITNGSTCGGYSTGTSCTSGQYWCGSTNSCKSNNETCPSYSGGYNDKTSCQASGGKWCMPTNGPHCHPGPNPGECEPDVPSGGYVPPVITCSAGQISCPGSYSGSYCYNGTTCPSVSSPMSCPSNQYMCNNVCILMGSSCNGYNLPSQPSIQPAQPSCDSASYWCSSSNSCIPMNSPCGTKQTICNITDYYCVALDKCVPSGTSCPTIQPQLATPTVGPQKSEGPSMFGPEGPSDEELQRIDDERFQMMKKGLTQFNRGVKQMEKLVKQMEPRLKRLGVAVPLELKSALAKAPELLKQIEQAKSPDELDELVPDIMDVGEVLQEWGPRFGDLMRLGEMLRNASTAIRTVERNVTRLEGYAKRNESLLDIVASIKELQLTMSQALKGAKELAQTDPEAVGEILDSDFYGRMEEFWNLVGQADMVRNITTGLRQAKKEITRAESKVRTMERSKKFDQPTLADLKELLIQLKDKYNEVQVLAKQRVEPEELRFVAEELWAASTAFENRLAELGQGYYMPTIKRGQDYQFELPQGFNFGSSSESGAGGVGSSNQPVTIPKF